MRIILNKIDRAGIAIASTFISRFCLVIAVMLSGCFGQDAESGEPAGTTDPSARASGAIMPTESEPPVFDDSGKIVKLVRTDAQWRRILTPEQYRVTRQGGTESPGRNAFFRHDESGVYSCIACGLALYSSQSKFEHCAGWPSFTGPVDPRHVVALTGSGGSLDGAEVVCGRCDSHLGHVFLDGPKPAGTRH